MTTLYWYLARILTRCSVEIDQEELFSEEFVLLRAASYEEAHRKALAKGETLRHSYLNGAREEVKWSPESVLEVKRILTDNIEDGCEIYARLLSVAPDVVPRGTLAE
jgi:Domain of unknown function (DUF4288)